MKPDNTVLKNLRLRDTKTEVREWSEKMAGGMLSNEWTLGGRTKLKFLAPADSLANGLANAWWLPGTGLQRDGSQARNTEGQILTTGVGLAARLARADRAHGVVAQAIGKIGGASCYLIYSCLRIFHKG